MHLADPVQTISLEISWGGSGRISPRSLGLRVREFRYHCYYVIAEQVSQGGPALPACVLTQEIGSRRQQLSAKHSNVLSATYLPPRRRFQDEFTFRHQVAGMRHTAIATT